MATAHTERQRPEHSGDYDLVVAIDSFEELANGLPGWEVRCPQIECVAAKRASTRQEEDPSSELKGAAAVAERLHRELQRRKLITKTSFGAAADTNNKLASDSHTRATEKEHSVDFGQTDTEKSSWEPMELSYESDDRATIFVAVVGMSPKSKHISESSIC